MDASARPDAPIARIAPSPRPWRRLALEFARYFLASAVAFAVDLGLFRALLQAGSAYPLAGCAGFVGGAVTAYLFSVRWVFSQRAMASRRREFALFVAIGIAGLGLTELGLWIAIDVLRLPPVPAKVGTAGLVFCFNFTVRRALLFSRTAPSSSAAA